MTRLEKLIQQFCPDGVAYKSIKQCTCKAESIKWGMDSKEYQYIDLSSVDRETKRITDTQTITANNAPSRAQQIIKAGDILLGTTRPMLKRYCLVDERYNGQICSTGFCVLRTNGIVLSGWLYHQIASNDFFNYVEKNQKGASYPSISDASVKEYCIPVPPLKVQQEIVRLLDQFTQLTAELTAELTARKQQYEYYKKELFSNLNAHKISMKDVCNNVFSGKSKDRLSDGVYPIYGSTGIISTTNTPTYSKEQILIARVGANAGFVQIAIGNYDVSDNTLIVDLKDGISLKFVYYQLSCMNLHQYAKGGGQPLITAGQIKHLEICVPTLEKQLEVVSILDRFDALCNDLTSGLPAEIAARQKQYEYYRDKLLDFKELG